MKTHDESHSCYFEFIASKVDTILGGRGKKCLPQLEVSSIFLFQLCSCHWYTNAPFAEICSTGPADFLSVPPLRRELKKNVTLMV